MAKFSRLIDVEYQFTLKRTASGHFQNLWSLELWRNGASEVIVDNDLLSTCVAKISYILESDGF